MARKKAPPIPPYRLITALSGLSLVAVWLLIIRIIESDSLRYVFLIWNLILAALSPLLAWWLVERARQYGWKKWQQISLAIAWVVFLPNSFYVITDFIHLRQTYEASFLYDIVMLMSFSVCSLIMGLMSIYIVHSELAKVLPKKKLWLGLGLLFLVSSFAITLGRFTRWNTWDIIFKPAGLLFDVSDRLINPAAHSDTYQVTAVFFVFLFSIYWVIWELGQTLKAR
jgi:uncharacterized membrane protein